MQLDIVRPRRMILDFPYSPWYEFPFIGEMTIQIDRELKELEETIKREMKESKFSEEQIIDEVKELLKDKNALDKTEEKRIYSDGNTTIIYIKKKKAEE